MRRLPRCRREGQEQGRPAAQRRRRSALGPSRGLQIFQGSD
ncbi:UNVERIFIED_CONTAM: hypothetical protein GTU68_021980 [Idotea baltica]|nr:hypothetical protein [Idotea baltica]